MARHAKILTDEQLARFEEWIKENSHNPVRDTVLINLSYRAGLRVAEMAQLRWEDVTDADGEVSTDVVHIPSQVTKFQYRDRTVPMHPKLRAALVRQRAGHSNDDFIINKGYEDGKNTPITANALTVYLHRLYAKAGFSDASSHSGRRTFVTKLARRANVHHCSIRDVQLLVGHAHIQTTERYIGPSDDVSSMIHKEL